MYKGEINMTEGLVSTIISIFGGFASNTMGKSIITFIISLLPVLELRGGLLAAGAMDLNPYIAYPVSIIGNILPIPFILLFFDKLFKWMKKIPLFNKFTNWLEKKVEKNKSKFEKGEFIGLILFVGIPLPGTGAWTGSLAVSLLGMNKKKAIIAILIGVVIASVIMMLLSYGLLNNLMYN